MKPSRASDYDSDDDSKKPEKKKIKVEVGEIKAEFKQKANSGAVMGQEEELQLLQKMKDESDTDEEYFERNLESKEEASLVL